MFMQESLCILSVFNVVIVRAGFDVGHVFPRVCWLPSPLEEVWLLLGYLKPVQVWGKASFLLPGYCFCEELGLSPSWSHTHEGQS